MKENILLKVSGSISVVPLLAGFMVEEWLGWMNVMNALFMGAIILYLTTTAPEDKESWKNFQTDMRWWLLGTFGWTILIVVGVFYMVVQYHK